MQFVYKANEQALESTKKLIAKATFIDRGCAVVIDYIATLRDIDTEYQNWFLNIAREWFTFQYGETALASSVEAAKCDKQDTRKRLIKRKQRLDLQVCL